MYFLHFEFEIFWRLHFMAFIGLSSDYTLLIHKRTPHFLFPTSELPLVNWIGKIKIIKTCLGTMFSVYLTFPIWKICINRCRISSHCVFAGTNAYDWRNSRINSSFYVRILKTVCRNYLAVISTKFLQLMLQGLLNACPPNREWT